MKKQELSTNDRSFRSIPRHPKPAVTPEVARVELLAGIGARLRSVRGDHTQEDFAKAMGVAKNTLARYERGENPPDATFLATLTLDHGVDANWLLTGRGPAPAAGDPSATATALHDLADAAHRLAKVLDAS